MISGDCRGLAFSPTPAQQGKARQGRARQEQVNGDGTKEITHSPFPAARCYDDSSRAGKSCGRSSAGASILRPRARMRLSSTVFSCGSAPAAPVLLALVLFLWVASTAPVTSRASRLYSMSLEPYALVRPNDLLAFYAFEGDGADTSPTGKTYSGTLSEPAVQISRHGFQGYGLLLSGSNYMDTSLDIGPSSHGKVTMGAWVKVQATNYGGDLHHSYDAFQCLLSADAGGFERSFCIDTRGTAGGWSAFTGSGASRGDNRALGVKQHEWSFVAVVCELKGGGASREE